MMRNLKEIKNTKGKTEVFAFGAIYTLSSITIIVFCNPQLSLVVGLNLIGAIILTDYFWNKHFQRQINYRKKNWAIPAIISTIITTGFVLALIYWVEYI